jgi:glycine betaine/proline transport system ATP-binding protein
MEAIEPAIRIQDLYKIYGLRPQQAVDRLRANPEAELDPGHFVALSNINLTINPGQICVVMGLSGSGKSTLLRCINRLIDPTFGKISVCGREVTNARRKELRNIRSSSIGMVFQHFALLPHMSVVENVALGLRITGITRKKRRERAGKALELVGLNGWGDRKPASLSGGMRQRVGLARALVMDTPVLLMDEPFSALDPLIRDEMQQELIRLQATLRKTIVFVTHDPNEAVILGDKIAILLKGRLIQQGRPMDMVLAPANDYVREFVRGIDIFRVLRAEQVTDPTRPAAVLSGSKVLPFALARPFVGPLPVTDASGKMLGLADRPGELTPTLSQDYLRLAPDAPIAPHLDTLAQPRSVVVAREDGTFVGMITPTSMLRALSAHYAHEASKDPPAPTPPQLAIDSVAANGGQ